MDDDAILDLCCGPTLHVGCGPGGLVAELTRRGHVALGIDVSPAAVVSTVDRGGSALRRDVFADVPGQGRWHTALLTDGSLAIGDDPEALLRRVRRLLDPRGRCVVEVGPGTDPDDLAGPARAAGLRVVHAGRHGSRFCLVLAESTDGAAG
ncbi:hypothetical protein GCM10023340_25460 [Nocardioides marinquilinus]|uniref:Methyltransferase type 11 domain-containing protein n=1 Tax=Nocardioides marinquilinus TaxID=1210400 RepID=A0ABP9PNZ4_9ACTN